MAASKYTILDETDVPGAKLTKDPGKCTVLELKRWLECHSLKKSGKKEDSIQRVREGLKTNLPVNPNIDGGKWYNMKTSGIKADCSSFSATPTVKNSAGNALFSNELPTTGWKVFPSRNIPNNFNYGHVYFSLVESVASAAGIQDSSDSDGDLYSTCDTVTAKPFRKGRNLLKGENVVDTQDNFDEPKQEYMLRTHVHHSMKAELPLNVFVIVSNVSGNVKRTGCDSRASEIGRCCHVAALLFKLSDYSSENNLVLKPSTSEPCTWDKGKKRAKKPEKLHETQYASNKRKPPGNLYNFDPRPENMRTVSNESVRNFTVSRQHDQKTSTFALEI
ncbi:uncharacterized protein [Clytia hemisphaerica]|uniref:uncharacterized protein n=1 Tax=Clytia hemisphaerica TaxID=252671 RepID=UPI0034D4DBF8